MRIDNKSDNMNNVIIDDLEQLYRDDLINWDSFRNKTVLITGAYGFLASYIVYMLIYLNELNKNYNINIITLCRDEDKLRSRFGKYIDKEYFINYTGDLSNKIVINNLKVNYIIHAASPAGTEHFTNNPVGVISPNVIGTFNLLEYARTTDINGVLFLSSNSIYGINRDSNDISEDDYGIVDPLNMRACYIESKRMGEQMCVAYYRQYGIPTRIVRVSHTYGPTLDIENDKRIIARICRNIIQGEEISLFKDEYAKVQYGYIGDVISGCFKVLLDGNDGEAYNVCSDEFLPMHEIAEIIVSLFPENKSKVIYKELTKEYLFTQNQGINYTKCSNQKLKDLGWKVKYPLAEGFKRTIESMNTIL